MAKKNVVLDYTDPETGKMTKVQVPEGTPLSEAHKGVPVSVDLSELYPEPFASKLHEALWAHGLITPEDFKVPGVHSLVRQALQDILRMDANSIVDHVVRSK